MPSPACTGNCSAHAPLDEVCDYCARNSQWCVRCGADEPVIALHMCEWCVGVVRPTACLTCNTVRARDKMQQAVDRMWQAIPDGYVCRDAELCFTDGVKAHSTRDRHAE